MSPILQATAGEVRELADPPVGPGPSDSRSSSATIAGAAAPVSVARGAARGVAWLMAQNALSRVVQSLAQVVMAWLLSPTDFGTISIVFTVSTLINALFQLGLDDVLLRRRAAMTMWFSTVFWMSLLFGCMSGAVLMIVAPMAALAYHEPRLTGLIDIMALGAPLYALAVVPQVILRSRLRFAVLSMVMLGDVLATSLLSIVLAAGGAGPYSFVLPLPLLAAGRAAAVWTAAKPSIRRIRPARRWRKLIPSASAVLGSRLVVQFIGQADYMVFGLTATASQVGLYYFAFRIAGQPVRLLAGSLVGVLLPSLTQFRGDPARQRRAVISSSKVLALVVMPLCFTQAAMAEPAIAQFFDGRWAGAAFFIQILSIGLAFDAVSWAIGTLLSARGDFSTALLYSIVMAIVFVTAIVAGALIDRSHGVPIAAALYYVVAQPAFCFFVLRRSGEVSLRSLLAIYAAPTVAAAIAVLFAMASIRQVSSPMARLLLLPSISLTLYSVTIWQISPGPCRLLLNRIKLMTEPRWISGS